MTRNFNLPPGTTWRHIEDGCPCESRRICDECDMGPEELETCPCCGEWFDVETCDKCPACDYQF